MSRSPRSSSEPGGGGSSICTSSVTVHPGAVIGAERRRVGAKRWRRGFGAIDAAEEMPPSRRWDCHRAAGLQSKHQEESGTKRGLLLASKEINL